MTQQPPEVFLSLVIYGDVRDKIVPTVEEPFFVKITDQIGVKPTKASCDDGVLVWEYALSAERTWDLPEYLYELIGKFNPTKVKACLDAYSLECEVKAAAYITDSYPCLFFSTELLGRISQMGAGMDIDCYQTSHPENRDLL